MMMRLRCDIDEPCCGIGAASREAVGVISDVADDEVDVIRDEGDVGSWRQLLIAEKKLAPRRALLSGR